MSDTYHLRVRKDYAKSLIELMKKDGAIEQLDEENIELSELQRKALDTELIRMESNNEYLQDWNEARNKLKRG